VEVTLQEVDRTNWREALALDVRPEQRHFVSDRAPPVAMALAKAYIRPTGLPVVPYGIYDRHAMVGFLVLAFERGSRDNYWLSHFFVDRRYQGHGYGRAALAALVRLLR
jgi:diamine N-acetyltransferase